MPERKILHFYAILLCFLMITSSSLEYISTLLLQIPITLHKERDYDQEGREILKCGFKIGGGIDQDYKKSPQGYTDYVRIFFPQGVFPLTPPFVAK